MTNYDPAYLKQLERAAQDVKLTADEARTLQWLAGWDSHTVNNVANIIQKARETERIRTPGLTKKDLLTVWGFLHCLKDIYENKARDLAGRSDSLEAYLVYDYMKKAAEITSLQAKIDNEEEQFEEEASCDGKE